MLECPRSWKINELHLSAVNRLTETGFRFRGVNSQEYEVSPEGLQGPAGPKVPLMVCGAI